MQPDDPTSTSQNDPGASAAESVLREVSGNDMPLRAGTRPPPCPPATLLQRMGLPACISLVVLVFLCGVCLFTLPYTLARTPAQVPSTSSASPEEPTVTPPVAMATPRYNSGSIVFARQPPRFDPSTIANAAAANIAPGSTIMGTDALGRSVFIRTLTGGGISLSVGLLAAALSVLIGTLWGTIAAYQGGAVDAVLMRTVDVLYGLPYVLLVVLLAVASDALIDEYISRQRERTRWERTQLTQYFVDQGQKSDSITVQLALDDTSKEMKPILADLRSRALTAIPPRNISSGVRTTLDVGTLLLAIGAVSWLTMARVIRGQVLSLKNQPFIEAARALGASPSRIFFRHLLPNLSGTIIVYATLTVPQAILQESFLSFLGVGIKPPLPSWGNLASDGLGELNPYKSHWWLLLFPCLLLSITLIALNLVGEGLRKAFDPKSNTR